MSGAIVVVYLAFIVVVIAGMWKTFVKAGRPGWEAIIPIYGTWILVTEIEKPGADKNLLHFILCLIPCVSIVGFVLVSMGVAERFGKDRSFGYLGILPFIFFPVIGFSDAQYNGG